MILVTVGTMLPFDRMVRVVDAWAARHPAEEVFAQIGDQGSYEPAHMGWVRSMTPVAFAQKADACRLIVAHAGTGSFFLAQQKRKPLVLFPRLARLKEHTSDHQMHTAKWLAEKVGVYAAMREEQLDEAIEGARAFSGDFSAEMMSPYAPAAFLARLRCALD